MTPDWFSLRLTGFFVVQGLLFANITNQHWSLSFSYLNRYMTTGKTTAWTRWALLLAKYVSVYNMLFNLIIVFFSKEQCLVSWPVIISAVIFQENNTIILFAMKWDYVWCYFLNVEFLANPLLLLYSSRDSSVSTIWCYLYLKVIDFSYSLCFPAQEFAWYILQVLKFSIYLLK